MAKNKGTPSPNDAIKKSIAQERKNLKKTQKEHKKEAKRRAKEISKKESELTDESIGNPISAVLVTIIIITAWLAVLVLLIKLDVGSFGSSVLRPVLKDIPVINLILPKDTSTEIDGEQGYYGYNSLSEAVEQIKALELQLESAQTLNNADAKEMELLRAEVARLQTFESKQVDFERVKNEFFEEVIYAQNGPGPEAFIKYYQAMDPATAELLFKQVVIMQEESKENIEYAQAYAQMKPKEAAAIFEAMEDNLELAAKILNIMDLEARGKILGAMDPEIAARLTKIMDPSS